MKKIILSALAIAFCSSMFAQSADDTKAWQAYMTPGDIHKMLAKYDGDWTEEITMWMAPGAAPMVNKATTKNEMVMGGRYQVSKTTGNMMGMPFEGMSTLGYDNAKKEFNSTWIDNFGTGTILLTGTWDDKTHIITLKGKEFDPMTGKDLQVKQTMQFIDDDNQLIEMFIANGQGEFKTMSIKITRKK